MKKTFYCTAIILATIFLPLTSYAWNALGHMLIANIAYQQLTPDVRQKVDDLVDHFHQEYSNISSFPIAACWPDRLREQKITTFVQWHYIDTPFSQDGTLLKNASDSNNAVWAIEKIIPVIKNKKSNVFERARFMAFFAHIVGDLHQPLHTVSRFSNQNPDGDRGGNLFNIRYEGRRSNLHKLWDMGVGAFSSKTSMQRFNEMTLNIMARYPEAYFANEAKNLNPNVWVKEGMDIAQTFAYQTQENTALTPAYIDRGKQIAEQRVALAGYRLGHLLNNLLSS